MLQALFGETGHIGWLQECARAVVIFVYGLVIIRLAGRRVFGKWAALDIIVSIIAGSSLSRALTGGADLFGTLAATSLLMVLHWVLARFVAVSPRLSRLIEGAPLTIAEAGAADAGRLVRHAVSDADLTEALHAAGLEDMSGARLVVLEPSGKISVLKDG